MNALLPELLEAHRLARRPDLAEALQACRLSTDGPVWGVSFIELDAHHYAPVAGGTPAIITPLFDADGALLDLVATGLQTRASRTRAGIATVLGQEWIDHARDTETTLWLFSDPIEWLRNARRGAVVVDWRAASYTLRDVPGIACATEFLAKQVDRAMRLPVRIPQIFVRELDRAA